MCVHVCVHVCVLSSEATMLGSELCGCAATAYFESPFNNCISFYIILLVSCFLFLFFFPVSRSSPLYLTRATPLMAAVCTYFFGLPLLRVLLLLLLLRLGVFLYTAASNHAPSLHKMRTIEGKVRERGRRVKGNIQDWNQ